MKVDKKRLKRQHQGLYHWFNNKYQGTFEWATGTGKTFLAILAIKHLIKRFGEDKYISILVVVPTDYLRNQWTRIIEEYKIPNVTVETVHMIIKNEHYFDILVLDEIHSYTGGEEFSRVFDCVKRQFIIGLTAQEREDPEDQALLNKHAPIIDKLSLEEALREGYVSEFTVYNLGLQLDPIYDRQYKSLHKQFIKYFSTFNHDLQLMFNALGKNEVCENMAQYMNWSPKDIKIHAVQCNRIMQQRKNFLYKAPILNETALQIIEKFPSRKIITFSEVTSTADELHEALVEKGIKSGVYHSSLSTLIFNKSGNQIAQAVKIDGKTRYKDAKKDIYTWKQLKFAYKRHKLHRVSKKRLKDGVMKAFEEGKTDVLNTARALNVGADIQGLDAAILCSFNSSTIDSIQRTGRAIRKEEGKRAFEVNLYLKNTQSERWLKNKQTQTPNVQWIDSVEQIV